MKRFAFLLSLAVVFAFAAGQLSAAPLLKGDFEDTNGINDPAGWNANNVTAGMMVFTVEGGRLKQTSDGCGNSTKTPAPVDGSGWTDYLVAADIWSYDNDVFSLLFRYTDADNYYNFSIGQSEYDQQWSLGNATALEGSCFDSADPPLDTGPHGVVVDESGGTAYTMAVMAVGSTLELFFGIQVDVEAGEMPPKVGEVVDSSHPSGGIGFHHGSNPFDIDNLIVLDMTGAAVDSQDKLATTWAGLKTD